MAKPSKPEYKMYKTNNTMSDVKNFLLCSEPPTISNFLPYLSFWIQLFFFFFFYWTTLTVFIMPRRSETSSSAKDDQSVPMEVIKTRRSIAGQSPKIKQSSTFSDDGTLSIQSDITSQVSEAPQKPPELKRALKARHVSTLMLRSNMDIILKFLLELTRGKPA